MTVNFTKETSTLHKIIELRYNILRKPWNQPKETVTDNLEAISFNAYIETESGKVIACGRLQENENKVGQIRYMAVDESFQGKGLGNKILKALEIKASEIGLKTIELQARDNALNFYKANNYELKEKSFLLWGIIQHYLMEKKIVERSV